MIIQASNISPDTSDHTLRIAVIDTGIGISSEDQKALFRPFSQLEPAMTRRHAGTGLGLAISKSLVELMGRAISVTSNPTRVGSCFSITLPLEFRETPHEKGEAYTTETKATLINRHFKIKKNLRILLADDNVINQQFLSTWLRQVGAVVDVVCDDEEAVKCYSKATYDIIFMDVHMPNMDGLEASKRIREAALGHSWPLIIAVTADTTVETKKLLMTPDIDDYLVKPIYETDLIKALNQWSATSEKTNNITLPVNHVDHSTEDQNEPVDRSLGLRLASGNVALWQQSLRNLSTQLLDQKTQLEHAFESNDRSRLNQMVHKIIGSASYCGATELLIASKKFKAQISKTEKSLMRDEFLHFMSTLSNTLNWIEHSDVFGT